MTEKQREDLREAFRKALWELDEENHIAVVETRYGGRIDTAVILVVEDAAPPVLARVNSVMAKRAGK